MTWMPIPRPAAADLDQRTRYARSVLTFVETLPPLAASRPCSDIEVMTPAAVEDDVPICPTWLQLVSGVEVLDQYLRWILDVNAIRVTRTSGSVAELFARFLDEQDGLVPQLELDARGMLDVIARLHRALMPLRASGPRGSSAPRPLLSAFCGGLVQHASAPSTALLLRITSAADALADLHAGRRFGVDRLHPLWIVRVASEPAHPERPLWDLDLDAVWAMAQWHQSPRFDLELRHEPTADRWLIPSEVLPSTGKVSFDAGDPRWRHFRA